VLAPIGFTFNDIYFHMSPRYARALVADFRRINKE